MPRMQAAARTTVLLADKANLAHRLAKTLNVPMTEVVRRGIVALSEKHGLDTANKRGHLWDFEVFGGHGAHDAAEDHDKYLHARGRA